MFDFYIISIVQILLSNSLIELSFFQNDRGNQKKRHSKMKFKMYEKIENTRMLINAYNSKTVKHSITIWKTSLSAKRLGFFFNLRANFQKCLLCETVLWTNRNNSNFHQLFAHLSSIKIHFIVCDQFSTFKENIIFHLFRPFFGTLFLLSSFSVTSIQI